MIVVFTTASNSKEAESLATGLVEARLAACVQILPKMTSIYAWEGKIEKEPEHLLLIKTLHEKYEEVEKFILDHHSYETPEVIAIEAEKVADGYLKWLTGYV